MHPRMELLQTATRRHFLQQTSAGVGGVALAGLLDDKNSAAAESVDLLAPKQPHFAAKAKQVIYLHLTGSPPHLDLFDYKPELVKHSNKECPNEFLEGKRFASRRVSPS